MREKPTAQELFTSKMAHKRNKRSSSAGPSNRSSHHSSSSSVYLDFLGRQSTPTEASTSSSIRSDFLGRRSSRSVSLSSANSPVQQKTARNRVRKAAQPKKRSKVMQEIRQLQNTTHLLIPRLPFQRLVREIVHKFNPELRLQQQTLEALQESAEIFLVQMFEDAALCAFHGKRVTLKSNDLRLVKLLSPINLFY